MFQDAFIYVLPLFAGFIIFELYLAQKKKLKIYSKQECLGNILCGILYISAKPAVQAVFYTAYLWASNKTQLLNLSTGQWWVWPLGFILTDFFYYWFHRTSHRIPLLWALHNVHHQPREMNMVASFRISILGNLPKAAFYLPMAILGIPLEVIVLSEVISLAYQMPAHTRVIGKLPQLIEYLFVTPSAHRVHHGFEKEYHNKNFGGVFLIWDRLFGTMQAEGSQISFGVDEDFKTSNPFKINYYPIQNWLKRKYKGQAVLIRAVLFILLFSLSSVEANALNPFQSDGCTANPNGNWGHCCYEHDYLYWKGGSFQDRKDADQRLRQCINEAGFLGEIAYRGVRAMGAEYWGSAWPNQNIRTDVTLEEQQAIENEYELWNLLGNSADFEFVVTETILFPSLTRSQKVLIQQETSKIKSTAGYREFLREYVSRAGILPLTE